jgi:hypothetical protein
MDESMLARQKEIQEMATIEKVESQLAEIRVADLNYQDKISDFIHHTVVPALRKKYGNPKPLSGDIDVHVRLTQYKLYHISLEALAIQICLI